MTVIQGTGASKGIAIGPAFFYRPAQLKIAARKPAQVTAEIARFEEALGRVRGEAQALQAALPPQLRPEADRLLEVQDLLLADPALVDRTRGAILDRRPAEVAWDEAVAAYLAIFSTIQNEDLRARAVILGDVGRQVLAALLGVSDLPPFAATREAVLIANTLGPIEFLHLAAQPPLGLCLIAAGLLPPAARILRRLELPAVVGLGETFLRQVKPENTVVVDGGAGLVEVEPEAETLTYYRDRQRLLKAAQPTFDVAAPAQTADGWRVDVRADLERPDRLLFALSRGAEGIGLARTDFLFIGKKAPPTEDEQEVAYRDLVGQSLEGRVTFCTLAVGAEEELPFSAEAEGAVNPLLGLRGVRLSLGYLSAFREQLRAMLRAGVGRALGIAFPMVETISEIRAAQEWLRRAQQDLQSADVPFCQDVTVALLVQTPLAIMGLEALLSEADSCLLDLDRVAEYLLACDRYNRRVAHLFHPLHPAVLRLVRDAVGTAHHQGKRLDVCGEYAGSPGAVAVLLGLGADGFCLPAERIAGAKGVIRDLFVPDVQDLAAQLLSMQNAAEVETHVEEFLEHHVGNAGKQ
jgi:phosphoenolpyruvate-protein kinase (PTS system EI component)